MKRIIVLAAVFATVLSSSTFADEFGRAFRGAAGATLGVVVVNGVTCAINPNLGIMCPGRVQPQYPAGQYARPGYAPPPQVARVPATTIVVTGARHLPGGGCVQSNERVGIVKNGMCFVPD